MLRERKNPNAIYAIPFLAPFFLSFTLVPSLTLKPPPTTVHDAVWMYSLFFYIPRNARFFEKLTHPLSSNPNARIASRPMFDAGKNFIEKTIFFHFRSVESRYAFRFAKKTCARRFPNGECSKQSSLSNTIPYSCCRGRRQGICLGLRSKFAFSQNIIQNFNKLLVPNFSVNFNSLL